MHKAFAASYFAAASVIVVIAGLQPGGPGPVAVFAAPWGASAPDIIARAGGRIISADSSGWIAVSDFSGTDDLLSRLYASGAAFVASSVVVRACAGVLTPSGSEDDE
ncbi:hypothetical protein [Roseibium suaedae]|uniref:Uncharacterized protein n=1 Tax=Roseibium suaedae TaxID=735517 RepID=A0A1M7FR49_9HYPH|nr:hypothetical protein [Roseibium suaedae]SHM06534.1 hypothetical protein SAMN05444272_1689 [Roseibium suaedae]